MSVTHTPMGRHSVLKSAQCRIFQQQEQVQASTLPSPHSPPAEIGTTPSSASANAVTDRTAKYRQFADECTALAKQVTIRTAHHESVLRWLGSGLFLRTGSRFRRGAERMAA